MKMIVVICPQHRQADVRRLMAEHDVHAFTELPEVIGEGVTGKHLGTHAWPGASTLIFTVVPEGKEAELTAALRGYAGSLQAAEGVRAFVMPVEKVV